MFEKKADTCVSIHELLAKRWSGRAFDHERSISQEHTLSLVEAARWAPSCYGAQPWHYIICNRTTNPVAWEKASACLVAGNQVWAKQAPLFFITVANTCFPDTGKVNRWGEYDTGAASENLSLQATALGLLTHQMGGFDSEQVRLSFHIPAQYTPMAIIAIGYQVDEKDISSTIREREYAERYRHQLGHNFFDGEWNTPICTQKR